MTMQVPLVIGLLSFMLIVLLLGLLTPLAAGTAYLAASIIGLLMTFCAYLAERKDDKP